MSSEAGRRATRRWAQLKRLKEEVQQGRADVIIGKNGVTQGVLEEIRRHLEDKGVVKVKALKTAIKSTGMDRRSLAKHVAEKLGAWLLDVRGRTFVLYLPPEKRSGSRAPAAGGEPAGPRRGNIRGWPRRLPTGERKPWSRR